MKNSNGFRLRVTTTLMGKIIIIPDRIFSDIVKETVICRVVSFYTHFPLYLYLRAPIK